MTKGAPTKLEYEMFRQKITCAELRTLAGIYSRQLTLARAGKPIAADASERIAKALGVDIKKLFTKVKFNGKAYKLD